MVSHPHIAVVLLAAGGSSRFGSENPKQVVDFLGEPLVRRMSLRLLEVSIGQLVVVTGHGGVAVRRAVAELPLSFAHNDRWADGQAGSVGIGVQALAPGIEAVVLQPVDQPLIDSDLIASLIRTQEHTGAPIVTSACGKRRGPPVVFARALFPELVGMRGDEGGRQILARHPERVVEVQLSRPDPLLDFDTPEELAALLARARES